MVSIFQMWRAMNSQLVNQFPLFVLLSIVFLIVEVTHADYAKPGCDSICGDVKIPSPFGIGTGCFDGDEWFEIECKSSPNSNGLKPYLSKFNTIEVIHISVGDESDDSYYTKIQVALPPMNSCLADTHHTVDLSGSPFHFSSEHNVFMMDGCPGSAVMSNKSQAMAGCGNVCNNSNRALQTKGCYGVHCCQTPLPSNRYGFNRPFQYYEVEFNPASSDPDGAQKCLVATIIESASVNEYVGKLSNSHHPSGAPVVLTWGLPSTPQDGYGPHAHCYLDYTAGPQSHCHCELGYYGNPYSSTGCKPAPECKDCHGDCYGSWDMEGHLFPGSYTCIKQPILKLPATIGLSASFGTVVLGLLLYGLYRFIKRQREIKRKAKFFKRNGGLLLKQQLSSKEGVVERTRIFSMNELDKATDHFNENRILGQGGQGTVYKGMLTDGSIVAIKKAKLLDESQLEQFINEVVILSQINHRNVVKLLGCCLETEVPLLVYEFVPNGTLYQHIHDPDEDFVISWEMCLKIATDSAAAIAYLHSSASIPIFHRDIKSSNILLDEKHKAKVSDFGSSRTIAIDQTHMTTLVQGTMGYLDPEYFQSYQFTEKSDVYSFGVVLLEFLTRKKPIFRDGSTMEQKNLVTEFLFLSQNSRLPDILNPKVVIEAKEDELISFVELTKRCISWSGKLRPTMKEVAMTLEMIMKSPAQVSRWYQEQEPFPVSDAGFDEYAMTDADFMSSTLPVGASSPLYPDVYPLLPDSK